MVKECGLQDLGFSGPRFTWTNNRNGVHEVLVRLDLAFGSSDFLQRFPGAKVNHVCMANSDHMALAVKVDHGHRPQASRGGGKRFHFEECWTTKEGCGDVVRAAWSTPQYGSPMFIVCEKIKRSRIAPHLEQEFSSDYAKED
ncbi:hypothetical protein FCV25MIE_30829 [Fagus crenata]